MNEVIGESFGAHGCYNSHSKVSQFLERILFILPKKEGSINTKTEVKDPPQPSYNDETGYFEPNPSVTVDTLSDICFHSS